MSLGYAEKLSYIEDVGKVGMAEFFDSSSVLQEKSKHLVVFTGAGISTSCGIPDFRGPKGIWTLQHEGKSLPEASLPFHGPMPGMTHMALIELEKAGILKFLISQNVDGQHLRSGIQGRNLLNCMGTPLWKLVLHVEPNVEVETIGLKETSRRCSNVDCGVKLKDTVLDWEEAFPPEEMNLVEKHCRMADVVLCLGTRYMETSHCHYDANNSVSVLVYNHSLQFADNNLPLKCLHGGGKILIVKLQKTPKDKKAGLVIHGLVDKVISGDMDLLNLQIPPHISIDLFQTILSKSLSADERYSIVVSFSDNHKYKEAIMIKEPFQLKRRTGRSERFEIFLKHNFSYGCGCLYIQITIPFDFEVLSRCFKHDKDAIFQKLKDNAVQDSCCGQTEVIERKVTLAARTETRVYAIVRHIKEFDHHLSNCDVKLQKERLNGTGTSRRWSRKHKPRS
ncbi:hypothetical protein SLE2022_019640 [Rubroshorea leprosula]